MLIRVIDFETTGLPPDAAVCEVGWCDVSATEDDVSVFAPVSHLCNPGRPIPPEAMAVHHITDEEVAAAISPDRAFGLAMAGADVFAAHNAEFEQHFFAGGSVPWICTWKVAVRLAPSAPSHGNQVLRYWLKLAVDQALAQPAHRAGPDAYVTAHLLARMLKKMNAPEMISISAEPALLPRLNFGKHAKVPIEDVPDDYLEWCLRQDMDANVKHTARHHLNARRAAQ